MRKNDENYSERRAERLRNEAAQQKQAEAAGDPSIPEGQMNENRKNYKKMLRPDYVFGVNTDAMEEDDVILGGGCNSITDEL